MTWPQWIYHYNEVVKYGSEERKELYSVIKMAGTFGHPKIDIEKVLSSIKSNGKTEAEEIQEAVDFIREHDDILPKEVEVVLEPRKKAKVPKGKIDKNLGIIVRTE